MRSIYFSCNQGNQGRIVRIRTDDLQVTSPNFSLQPSRLLQWSTYLTISLIYQTLYMNNSPKYTPNWSQYHQHKRYFSDCHVISSLIFLKCAGYFETLLKKEFLFSSYFSHIIFIYKHFLFWAFFSKKVCRWAVKKNKTTKMYKLSQINHFNCSMSNKEERRKLGRRCRNIYLIVEQFSIIKCTVTIESYCSASLTLKIRQTTWFSTKSSGRQLHNLKTIKINIQKG